MTFTRNAADVWENGLDLNKEHVRQWGLEVEGVVTGIVSVETYGAVGDCAFTGSTAGATLNSQAFKDAFDACPDGGIVKLRPGACYCLEGFGDTDEATHAANGPVITCTGKSIYVDARGATIRAHDDTKWGVIVLGGADEDNYVENVEWIGGTLDGNKDRQIYWPNTDGTTIFTDAGEETLPATGTPFYSNSSKNGTLWLDGWYNGAATSQNSFGTWPTFAENGGSSSRDPRYVDLQGGGNDGFIQVDRARRVVFRDIILKDIVRNGLMAGNCDTVLFDNIKGTGQLSTNYFELAALGFGSGAEACYLKTNARARGGTLRMMPDADYVDSVVIRDCLFEGGSLPIFVRTHQHGQKPSMPLTRAHLINVRAYGYRRDVWFEIAGEVFIDRCDFVGHGIIAPNATYSATSGLLIGNNARHVRINDSFVLGQVDLKNTHNNVQVDVIGSVLSMPAGTADEIVNCTNFIRSRAESASGGVDAENIEDAVILAEGQTYVRASARNLTLGALRWADAVEHSQTDGQTSLDLGDANFEVQRIERRNNNVCGGRWLPVPEPDWSILAGVITFEQPSNADDIIRVHGNTVHEDTFTATASQTDFEGTQDGSIRAEDIIAVTVDGGAVPYELQPPQTGTQPFIELDSALVGGETVVIKYRPPLVNYGALRVRDGEPAVIDNMTAKNIEGVYVDSDMTLVNSLIEDAAGLDGETTVQVAEDMSLTAIDTVFNRHPGSVFRAPFTGTTPLRGGGITLRGGAVKNWSMMGRELPGSPRTRNAFAGRDGNQFSTESPIIIEGTNLQKADGIEMTDAPEIGGVGTTTFTCPSVRMIGVTSDDDDIARAFSDATARQTDFRWRVSGAVSLTSLADAGRDDVTFTVTGAEAGDAVNVTRATDLAAGLDIVEGWVSANNTVTVRVLNASGGVLNGAQGSVNIEVRAP